MKSFHKYLLLGCAGATAVTISIAAGKYIGDDLHDQREAAAQKLEQVRVRKQDLADTLRNCSSVEECRTTFADYNIVSELYDTESNSYREVEQKTSNTLNTVEGNLAWLLGLAGGATLMIGLTGAMRKRRHEKYVFQKMKVSGED